PADRGFDTFGFNLRPTAFDAGGCSYRLNAYLPDNYVNAGLAVDPIYNIAGKKESWVTEPSRFIVIHELAAYPFDDNGTIKVTLWHGAANPGKSLNAARGIPGKAVAPVLFVDGHSQQCDFTANILRNPQRGLEPGNDWMWYKPVR
ncbi:MAG TPA: hypothetical protein DCE44_06920, partial [Verrucomicrobiales bacterium]|nr:hypothetical protein [Verrucomicrobiales bacterium]